MRALSFAFVASFLLGTVAAAPAATTYVPLKSLPHPGEFFFNLDEVRARGAEAPSSCLEAVNFPAPSEPPQVKVSGKDGVDGVAGNLFAIHLLGASSYLMRVKPGPEGPHRKVLRAKEDLLEWARADALREFVPNNTGKWWAVYEAFPAILITYGALKHEGMLADDERKVVKEWMGRLLKRTQVGVELDFGGRPYRLHDDRIGNKNNRRNLISLLWAVENNDVAMFNRAIENGYIRFLKTMRPDGSTPDSNRGNWALAYSAINIDAAMFLAEAASHQGVDLYAMEIEGKSIHKAVKFLLDGNDDSAVIGQYARNNAGMETKGRGLDQYKGVQDPWWKNSSLLGLSRIAWAELYISRFPDSDNARRLRILLEEHRRKVYPRYLLDFAFGNVSCFWGDGAP